MLTKNLTTAQAREQLVSMLAGLPALPGADLDRLVAQAELEPGVPMTWMVPLRLAGL